MTSAKTLLPKKLAALAAAMIVGASMTLWPTASESASRNNSGRSTILRPVVPKQPPAGQRSTTVRPGTKSPRGTATGKQISDSPTVKRCLARCDRANYKCTRYTGGELQSEGYGVMCWDHITTCVGNCRRKDLE